MARWWSRKYRLPSCSPLYTSQTMAHWQREFLDDVMHDRDALIRELVTFRSANAGGQGVDAKALRITTETMLTRINAMGALLEMEPMVLDPEMARVKQQVSQGIRPASFSRIEDHVAMLRRKGLIGDEDG